MHEALEECAGREDHRRRLEDLANLRLDPAHGAALDDQPLDARLPHLQIRRALEHALAARSIRGLVRLRAARTHGRTLARVQKPELDSGLVSRQAHLAAQRVDLPYQMPLADPADRRITRHLPDMVEIEREHQRARTHPRRRERRFDSGMAGADNNDIVVHDEAAIMARLEASRKAMVTTNRSDVSTTVVETYLM